MRVVILIAGAGGMYCGSCIRDNRLAATLRAKGRDVLLLPLYTPIRTDEEDVSESTVLYGGINVYLQQKSAVFQHMPGLLDRALDSPALLRGVGRLAVKTRAENLGGMAVSVLKGPAGAQRKELKKLIKALRAIEPDIVHLPNLMMVGMAAALKEELGVRVVCSLSGEDIFLDALPEPFRAEAFDLIRKGAQSVDCITAPTHYYAAHAANHFGLPVDRIHFVPMGIHVEDFEGEDALSGQPFTIGYLARICREKGLAELVESFIRLRRAGRRCRLKAAGFLGAADHAYFDEVQKKLRVNGFFEDFEYWGAVSREEKIKFLKSLHVFSVPTLYHEAKGLYVLEAMAAGVPVVLPRHGSFPEWVAATGGGILYNPDDEDPGARGSAALVRLMDDSALREELAGKARAGVRAQFTDEIMADRTWELYQRLVGSVADRAKHVAS